MYVCERERERETERERERGEVSFSGSTVTVNETCRSLTLSNVTLLGTDNRKR